MKLNKGNYYDGMSADEFMQQNRKERKSNRKEESRLQIACVNWFRLCYPDYIIFSVPNGGSRNKREGAALKKQGVLAGCSDLVIPHSNKFYHCLFIEMKSGNGVHAKMQKEFERKMKIAGNQYLIIKTFEDFCKEIENYLK